MARPPTGQEQAVAELGLITDLDGNMIEVVYRPPPQYPSDYAGETWRVTNSTTEEAAKIVGWNFDIGRLSLSDPPGPGSASSGSARTASRRSHAQYPEDDDQPQPGLRRSVTAGSSVYEPATSAENSNGLSAGAVVGTLLGVAAAGAAAFTTYTMVRDRSRAPRQEYDMPSFSRRSTLPESYDAYPDPGRKSRYIEVERAVDKIPYQNDYPPASEYRRPPEYIARYSQVGSTRSRERSREPEDRYDDLRGRHPSSRSRATSSRPPSQSASHREAYDEPERRSYVSSKSSRHPPVVQRNYSYDIPDRDRDRDSLVSSKSHRSTSTLRARPPPESYNPVPHTSSRSRSSSRVTSATIKGSGHPRTYSRGGEL